jgi:hypothetical protein
MISKIGYCPFGEDEALKTLADVVIKGHNSQHRFFSRFHPILLFPVEGRTVLSIVGIDQQLYVFAHGAIGDNRVHSAAAADHAAMDVTALAKQLKAQGLPLGIKKIKMWVCNSGRQNTDGHSTAEYFKNAMRAEGYNAVTIFGYALSLLDHVNKKGSKIGVSEAGETRIAPVKAESASRERALQDARENAVRGMDNAWEADMLDDYIATRSRAAGGAPAPDLLEPLETRFRESEKIPARAVRTIHSGPAPVTGAPIVSPPGAVKKG